MCFNCPGQKKVLRQDYSVIVLMMQILGFDFGAFNSSSFGFCILVQKFWAEIKAICPSNTAAIFKHDLLEKCPII